jgi:hypothetical protein
MPRLLSLTAEAVLTQFLQLTPNREYNLLNINQGGGFTWTTKEFLPATAIRMSAVPPGHAHIVVEGTLHWSEVDPNRSSSLEYWSGI